VLGGLGSILGSIVGAAILVIVPQFLTVFHEFEHIVLGTVIVVLLIFLPDGIVPAATPLVRRRAT
jgi:branched-chain amino acid transport system permease protein